MQDYCEFARDMFCIHRTIPGVRFDEQELTVTKANEVVYPL
jgi:hypothetical protein